MRLNEKNFNQRTNALELAQHILLHRKILALMPGFQMAVDFDSQQVHART